MPLRPSLEKYACCRISLAPSLADRYPVPCIIPILISTISLRSSCCLPLPFPLPGFFLKNVARFFSFVSLNSLKDGVFLPLVSSRTFISLLFARSFPHLGQNLNETYKDCTLHKWNKTWRRRKEEQLRNPFFFSANTCGPGANVL